MGGGSWSYLRPLYSFPLLTFLAHALSQQGLNISDSALHEQKTLIDQIHFYNKFQKKFSICIIIKICIIKKTHYITNSVILVT